MSYTKSQAASLRDRSTPNTNAENVSGISTQDTVLEEILPSFQMHNYIFNRPIYETELESTFPIEDLPDYRSELNTLSSFDYNYSRSENDTINGRRYNNNDIDLIGNPKLLLLNNIDKLSNADLPIDIKIVLTKRQAMIGKLYEREIPLIQYSPGDLVTGYVTIKSLLNQPIPFDVLLVSLEGEVKTPNNGLKSEDRKILNKIFLKMYDLNACYHSGNIRMESHGMNNQTEPLVKDEIDNTFLGFDNSKMILPGMIHKKFFTFKLPHTLLDNICDEQFAEHLKLLPSYGFDFQSLKELSDVEDFENLHVDPVLGYKRCETKLGSPIKVNDTALKGQSISYYIKVEMIGLNSTIKNLALSSRAKSASSLTSTQSAYSIFKTEKHYFRVDVSEEVNSSNEQIVIGNKTLVNTSIRTYEQLLHIENNVSRTIEELKTKSQLINAGIINKIEQDEIVAELEVDEAKKVEQLRSSTNFHPEIVRSDESSFLHYHSLTISKDLFNKSGGELMIKASMLRDSKISAIKPFAFKNKTCSSSLKTVDNLKQVSSNEENGTSRISHLVSKLNHSIVDKTLLPTKSLPSSNNNSENHCFIELEIKFIPDNHVSSKHELPTNITISPSLKSINIYSSHAIPISIDGEFLMDEQLLQYTLPNIRKHYQVYLTQLKKLATEGKVSIPKALYNSVNGLSKLSVKETYVPNIEFSNEAINLTNQWVYDAHDSSYKAIIKVPLTMNSKANHNNGVCLVPTFQSCLVNQFYMIHFHVTLKRAKRHCVFKFPLKVV